MPEVHFDVRWPDDTKLRYYSPSRAVREQLKQGERYLVPDFLARVAAAMEVASARVEAKFGYRCSSAADTLASIQEYSVTLPADLQSKGKVTIEHVDDP